MGYKAIRDGLYNLINNNLDAVTGTSYKVFSRIPENIVDLNGYSVVIQWPNSSFRKTGTGVYNDDQIWIIDVFSPTAFTGYRTEQEDRILDYADNLVAIFVNNSSLTTTGQIGVELNSCRFTDEGYPSGVDTVSYHFRLLITVHASRVKDC